VFALEQAVGKGVYLTMKNFAGFLFLILSVVVQSARAQASTTVVLEPIVGGLLKMHAKLGGQDGTFLFDSGSGISSLSPEFARAIGCRPWGQITGFRMTGQRLDMQRCDNVTISVAGKSLPASTLGVFDISKYLPSDVGHIDGTIALDLFANQALTLSYGGHFIRLVDQSTLGNETKGLRSMPVHLVRDAEGLALTVNLPVVTPAGTAWFEMDSGNTSNLVLVNKALAPLFQLKTGGMDGSAISLELENGTAFIGAARVLELILDGNLGTSFLATHNVTVDLSHQTAWISAYPQVSAAMTR
jgi:hypothetical protein